MKRTNRIGLKCAVIAILLFAMYPILDVTMRVTFVSNDQGVVDWDVWFCVLEASPPPVYEPLPGPGSPRFVAEVLLVPRWTRHKDGANLTNSLFVPLWPLVIPLLLGLVWILVRRPYADSACWHCGYDLTGNVSGVCPECGAAIAGEVGKMGTLAPPDE